MKIATTLIVFLVLTTLGFAVACGGSDIPDDVEWSIVAPMEPAMFGGGNYRVQLNKPVSEDTLRAIGKEVKRRHGDRYIFEDSPTGRYRSNHATVRTWFYLPGMDISDAAWGQARFDPDKETIEIWGNRQPPRDEPISGPLISAEEYRATVIALFWELQSMVDEGLLDPRGPDLGFSPGNPRAQQWRKDVQELRRKEGTFQDGLSWEESCWRLSDAAGDFVCGTELISFVTVIVGDHWEEYQEWARKFEAAAELEGK